MATHNLGRVAYADKGAYNSSTTYINKDVVQYNNGSYVLQADTATGIVPTNTSYWTPMQNPTALNQATASANTAAQSANTAANSAVKAAETANTVMNNTASPIRKSATGKCIELDNASDKPLRGLKLYGRTEQIKTTGKNLLPNTVSTTVNNGITFTSNTDGTIAANGTSLADWDAYCIVGTATLVVGEKYLLTGCPSGGGFGIGLDGTGIYDWGDGIEFTAETENYTPVLIVGKNKTISNIVFKPMIRPASVTDATYEPYTGGIPGPNPDYPLPLVSPGDSGSIGVKATGKNLLKNQMVEETRLVAGITFVKNADGSITANGTSTDRATINIGGHEYPAGEYIFSQGFVGNHNGAVSYAAFERDGTTVYVDLVGVKEQKFVLPEATYVNTFCEVRVANVAVTNHRFCPMIRHASVTDDAYEPYKDGGSVTFSTPNGLPGIPISSGGNYKDTDGQQWICDEIDFGRGVYVQRVKLFSLSQVSSWSQWGAHWYNHTYLQDSAATYNAILGVCTHVERLNNYLDASYMPHSDIVNGRGVGIQISNAAEKWGFTGSTAEEFKAFVDAKDIKLVYTCVPTETPLSASELAAFRAMTTFNPYTVVYSDSDVEMTVDYIGETEKFVHEVIDDRTAPPIIETASGSITSVNDSAHRPLKGLRLYGKTTQDGTPAPDSPVPLVNAGAGGSIGVKAQGKNLLDVSCVPASQTLQGVTLVNNGDGTLSFSGTAVNNSAWSFALNTPIPAGVYTLSANNEKTAQSGSLNLYFMDSDGTDAPAAQMSAGANTTRVFTVNRPITHMKVYFTAGVVTNGVTIRPQLEIGSTATAYEQYADGGHLTASTPNGLPGTPVTSGGNYTDEHGQQWLCDEIDLARGVYIQRVGRILIDSTNTSLSLQNSGGLCQAFASPSPYVPGYAVDPSPYMMCDTLPPVPRKNAAEQAINGASLTGDHILLRVAGVTTIAGMREWLAANPTTVLYQPAQPIAIETPIPASELAAFRAMTSQKPVTTVYNDAGAGVVVDYIADTKAYIDKKLAAIAATLIE